MKAFLVQLRQLYGLFLPKERRQLLWVLVGMLVTGLFEVAGVGSVVPFLAVAAAPEKVITNAWVGPLYRALGFTNVQQFVVVLGLAVIGFLFLSNAVKGTVFYFTVRFTKLRMASMTSRLFEHFLLQPYSFFLRKNTADVLKSILADLPQTLDGILDPLLDMLSKGVIVIGLVGLVMLTDPVMALGVMGVFGLSYLILFNAVRKPLGRRGRQSNELAVERFRHVNEALGGVKEVKFVGIEARYLDRYEKMARTEFLNDASRDILSAFPKYFLEVIAFGGIIGVVLIYMATGRSLTDVLPVLGLYAFAGYRLMPYLQQIFADMAKIRFTAVRLQMTIDAFHDGGPVQPWSWNRAERMPFHRLIELRDLSFRYPGTDRDVLHSLSLRIPCHQTVGLVGASGAGKSTLVDLLLGLLPIPAHSIILDGTELDEANVSSWKSMVGYVPQQIYLSDTSIGRNIAFGVPEDEIDWPLVERAARLAHLHEFVSNELPDAYHTVTGERGVRLSGGQRQRIGIARALYRQPEVLILDEATSALDGITENAIMEAIHGLGHSMTIIIIAHRLTTLRECDRIYVLREGTIADQGTYESLLVNNEQFREMAGEGRTS